MAQAASWPRRCRRPGGCARPRRGGAGRRRRSAAPPARARRRGRTLRRGGRVLHRHVHGSGRHPDTARRGRRHAGRRLPPQAVAPVRGDRDARRCGTRSCASRSRACSSAPCAFATPTITPPCCRAAGGRCRWTRSPAASPERRPPRPPTASPGRRLGDVDRRADVDLVVELLDVRDVHADAAVRAAEPIEPSSAVPWMPAPSKMPIQRALIGFPRPRRDHLAGEIARPGRVGHVPGGIDRLVLDVVEPRRRLQPDLADGDV